MSAGGTPTATTVESDRNIELAAVVAVLTALTTPAAEPVAFRTHRGWTDRAALLGAVPHAGPGTWRAAAHPRSPGC